MANHNGEEDNAQIHIAYSSPRSVLLSEEMIFLFGSLLFGVFSNLSHIVTFVTFCHFSHADERFENRQR